jgi:hypothetical protein
VAVILPIDQRCCFDFVRDLFYISAGEMTPNVLFLIFLLSGFQCVPAFLQQRPALLKRTASRLSLKASLDLNSFFLSVSTAVAKPDNYEYGAVSAPGWVLPVGAVLVILTGTLSVRVLYLKYPTLL